MGIFKRILRVGKQQVEKGLDKLEDDIKILEDLDFDKIKVSLKSSDVPTTIEAYRLFSEKHDYPLHLGITESGTLKGGLVKSSVGIGTLLAQGIGDTIRVSLTEDPVEEVHAGYAILKSLNLRHKGVNFISCPTCGRTQIDLIKIAEQVEKRLESVNKDIKVELTTISNLTNKDSNNIYSGEHGGSEKWSYLLDVK